MRSIQCAVAALCAVTFGLAAGSEPTGPELLTNGSLEIVDAGRMMPVGWSGFSTPDWGDCAGTAEATQEGPHEGEQCVKVSGVRTQYAVAHSRVSVLPGKTYLLTGWVRSDLLRGQTAYLAASWSSETRWLSLETSRTLAGRSPWTRLELVLAPETRSEDSATLQVSFRIKGTAERGVAYVDDLSLRECRPAAPQPDLGSERRRQIDMARELLVEREVWRDRLSVLEARHRDLGTLLSEAAVFEDLVRRHGQSIRRHEFLTQEPHRRGLLEARAAQDEASVRAHIDELADLPVLRQACFDELQGILALKRRLDAQPDLRRFYLWAQLAAMRREIPTSEAPRNLEVSNEFMEACAQPPEQVSGELLDLVARSRIDPVTGTGVVRIATSVGSGEADGTVRAGLLTPGGRVAAFREMDLSGEQTDLSLTVPDPQLWFPDCRYLYTLHVGLFRDGKPVDWVQQKLCFRDVAVRESDVTATMRHAWSWALSDYTVTVNGQPYFLRGTVCGEARSRAEEAEPLFRELWLDFNRTYGSFLSGLTADQADDLASRGLTYFGSLSPNYRGIRRYVSSQEGLDEYAETVRRSRWVADHPDLPGVYGRDLWHCFNEATKVLRRELRPSLPVGYVRAANHRQVLPIPREDYSGINQYTGRYWGRRCTMASDLHALSLAATLGNKPMGITEWNGPKYSWATRGVSGVDENGAAEYIFDYYRTMLRTPMTLLSTEFVLNWVVTPLEDLTTVPLGEGLKRRDRWRWSKQQGVPWYPAIWPDLLTDTPARRAMGGFYGPLYELCEGRGQIAVLAPPERLDQARALGLALRKIGKDVSVATMPTSEGLRGLDANSLIVGGTGASQPEPIRDLERMGVIGATSDEFPAAGDFLIQRRVNPHFPDRFLVAVTAADETGMSEAITRLLASADGLGEAYARHASCRRALALVDDRESILRNFSRYVLELPTRGTFLGRDEVRTALKRDELLGEDGKLAPNWADLAAVIVATTRELNAEELDLLRELPAVGVNVVWSAGTLRANPQLQSGLGVDLGAQRSLTEGLPVAEWAQEPLAVPDMGDVSEEPVAKYSTIKRDSTGWNAALSVHELILGDKWQAAATTSDGHAVVARRSGQPGSQWVFGVDLQAASSALVSTTQRGVLHSIYDRDTACGLERVFRLVANACVSGVEPRASSTPRLRAEIIPDRELYSEDGLVRVTVRVRDSLGSPVDASVRVSCGKNDRFLGKPGDRPLWREVSRVCEGNYVCEVDLSSADGPVADVWRASHRGEQVLTIFADATRLGWVSDWTAHTVRIGSQTDEAARLASLTRLVREGLTECRLSVADREAWIELEARLTLPSTIEPGKSARMTLTVDRVEDDRGNDWLEDVAVVLRPLEGGEPVRIQVAEGKLISSVNAPVVTKRPDDTIEVDSTHPASFELVWPRPKPGLWDIALSYRYSDDYHIKDTDRLLREDAFNRSVFEVVGDE